MLSPGQFGRLKRVLQLRRREARLVRAAVLVVLALGVLGLAAYVLAGITPAWWTGANFALESPDAARISTVLENAIVTELSRVRPERTASASGAGGSDTADGASDRWAVRIKSDELNAWLSTKLPRWIEGEELGRGKTWPRTVRDFRLVFDQGMLTVGARVGEGAGRVVWLRCRPEVHAGELWLASASTGVGLLPVPLRALLPTKGGGALVQAGEGIRSGWAGFAETPALRQALLGEAATITDPSVRLADGRHVRLLDVKLEPGVIVVTCVTTR